MALWRSNNLYYIYSDHLSTPRAITDTANNLVWTWENSEVFGDSTPNDTLSGSNFTFNLRFPGQYFDKESNNSYNYYRDYNASIGRYIQSDPIGLAGGINTYNYVGGNSLIAIDSLGLDTVNFGLGPQFFWEEIIKGNNILQSKDVLRILSHGNPQSMSGFIPQLMGDQIFSGQFQTAYGLKTNNYFQERMKKNLDINIILDSCDTGAHARDANRKIINPYARELGNYLTDIIAQSNSKSKITIIAPNGLTQWQVFRDAVDKPHVSPDLNRIEGGFIQFNFKP